MPYVKSVRKLIRDEHFDIVHTHTETGGLILRLVGKTGAKYLYTPHGMSFYKGAPIKAQLAYRPIEHWICTGMDNNIAINLEEYQILKKWNSKTALFIHGIGLNIDRFHQVNKSRQEIRSELGIPEDAAVVLSIGELDDNKNHCVVLEALRYTSAYYLICGVGPNKDKLLQLANEYGMKKRVVLAGYRKDIPDIIHSCDVFAFPSIHEGLPVSLMEAMAGGLPVVCSRIRGNVDLIEDGVNGYLVEPHDLGKWTSALVEIISDKSIQNEFIGKSSQKIVKYSYQNIFIELKSIYSMYT